MERRCEEVQPLLMLLAAEELPASEGHTVTDHLAECAACRGEWEALRQGLDALSALPPVVPPDAVRARVRARIRWEREGRRLVRALRPLAAAAMLLVAVVAWVAMRNASSHGDVTVEGVPGRQLPLAETPHWRNGAERGLVDVWLDVRDMEAGRTIVSPAVPPEGLVARSAWPSDLDEGARALRWEWEQGGDGGFDLRMQDLKESIDDLSKAKGS